MMYPSEHLEDLHSYKSEYLLVVQEDSPGQENLSHHSAGISSPISDNDKLYIVVPPSVVM